MGVSKTISGLAFAVVALAVFANAFYIDEADLVPLVRERRQSSFSSILSSLGGLGGIMGSIGTPEGRQRIGGLLINYIRGKGPAGEEKFVNKIRDLAGRGRLVGIIRTLETTLSLPDGSANTDLQRLTAVAESLLPPGEDRNFIVGILTRALDGGASPQGGNINNNNNNNNGPRGMLGRGAQGFMRGGGLAGALDRLTGIVSDQLSRPGALDRLGAKMQELAQSGRLERILARAERFLQLTPSSPALADRVANVASVVLGSGPLGQQVGGAIQAIFSRLNGAPSNGLGNGFPAVPA